MDTRTNLRLRYKQGWTEVFVLIKHPMNTGQQHKGKHNSQSPEHYIEQLLFKHNDRLVATAHLGPDIAENPLTVIALNDAKPGDTVSVSWFDNQGEHETAESRVGNS